jgi:hypothetical protein
MYIHPHVFETISLPIHAERIANAERRRFATTIVEENSNVPAVFYDASMRRLRAVHALALRVARLRYDRRRLAARVE